MSQADAQQFSVDILMMTWKIIMAETIKIKQPYRKLLGKIGGKNLIPFLAVTAHLIVTLLCYALFDKKNVVKNDEVVEAICLRVFFGKFAMYTLLVFFA